ncbi:ORF6N domain-containing protein [Desulfonema magnum]|uniref:DNA-binding domain-containing protein n=1 Tax=Desulfonema magnum TaxID=45655 RepID=A0A975GKE0_9BACT|nr:ORF6N domain-containing protein [Desulfonema magnum]QTA84644.1 DNA-binding domain-containing protein [Desulfonema magnum]
MNQEKRLINIEGKEVERIEYRGQAVVTFRMIDGLHEKTDGAARNAFYRHKDKFIEKEDFFDVPYEEWSEIIAVNMVNGDGKQRNPVKFITESGYLMLVKPFSDDLAWKIQRALVKNYFVVKENLASESERGIPIRELAAQTASAMEMARNMGFKGSKATLSANEIVRNATGYDCLELMGATHYFTDDDTDDPFAPTPTEAVACFVEDVCVVGPHYKAGKSELFIDYARYCSEHGYPVEEDSKFLGYLCAVVGNLQIYKVSVRGISLRRKPMTVKREFRPKVVSPK